MYSMFLMKKILSAVLLPPIMPLLLMALALAVREWRPRTGRWLSWIALAVLVAFSTPATVDLMTRPLERFEVATPEQISQTQAIVILAGGKRGYAPEFTGSAPSRLTLERLRYGALVARRSGLPVLVSGGAPTGQKPESVLMAESLREDFHIPVKWMETDSLDTHDNAVNSAEILKRAGITRVTLVTHAAHMWRSVNEFTAQGIEVLPAPTAFLTGGSFGEEFFRYIPNITSTYAGWYAAHEWVGLWAQWLRERF
ncbi:YdcF family protein [Uliginosibacterium sp. sgz301328]|uniref:YdcF family protein n=1 Tax=Uliginosibacterium sp. sgz301328 TaxID=3243764 RepID=UPI00359CD966